MENDLTSICSHHSRPLGERRSCKGRGSHRPASGWTESEEEADARSLLGYLVLRERLPVSGAPAVLVELLDETNAGLFADGRTEILVTPLILSHVMAQVALRRELGDVLDELFGPGGTETLLRSALELGFHGQDMTFAELRTRLAPAGEIPIGVRRPTQGKSAERLCLNPSDHTRWRLTEQDEIVVIRPPFEDDVSSAGGPQEG